MIETAVISTSTEVKKKGTGETTPTDSVKIEINYAPSDEWDGAPEAPSDKVLQANPEEIGLKFYNAVKNKNIGKPA